MLKYNYMLHESATQFKSQSAVFLVLLTYLRLSKFLILFFKILVL